MPKVSPGLRRYIAAALSSGGASGADAAAMELLQDSDPNIIDATARSVLHQVTTLPPARRHGLVQELTGLLTRKKGPVSAASEAAVWAATNCWLFERACASAASSVNGAAEPGGAAPGCGAAGVCADATGPTSRRPAARHQPMTPSMESLTSSRRPAL